jgi:hypothetical protein
MSTCPVALSVTKVGNVTECVQSKEYILPLTDLSGNTWTIKAYGLEEVTADISELIHDTELIISNTPSFALSLFII